MNVNKLPISLVIPTINRPVSLKRTIDSYLSKFYIPNQIIIIDQSQDAENKQLNLECIKECKKIVDVTYIHQDIPSLTKARNEGFTYCNNEIIIFSDDDVDVFNDTIFNLYNIMQDLSISMVAGVDSNESLRSSWLSYLFCKKSYKNRFIGHVTLSMLGRYPDEVIGEVGTMWAMGYFFAIKKSLKCNWNICWDERLIGSAYPEDLDFSFTYYKKSKENNYRCILSDKVKVKHLRTQEFRENSFKNTCMYIINRDYLCYKHNRGLLALMANRWTNLGEFLYRLIYNKRPLDVLRAQFYCDIYRKDIKKGILHYELYNY